MPTQPFSIKRFAWASLALLALGSVSCSGANEKDQSATPRHFREQDAQGTYTTYAKTASGKQATTRWKSEYSSKSGWTPEARRKEVSPKFQQAADNKQLNHITNDTQNNLPVLRAAIDENERCGLMLFTLQPEDDPETVRKMLIDLGKGSAMDPVPQSGSYKVYVPMSDVLQNMPFE